PCGITRSRATGRELKIPRKSRPSARAAACCRVSAMPGSARSRLVKSAEPACWMAISLTISGIQYSSLVRSAGGAYNSRPARWRSFMSQRSASVSRDTLETRIRVSVNLDGTGKSQLATGLPFLDHMVDQIARHGLIDISIEAEGDLHIDAHHTVEDVGITLGQ